MSHIRMLAVIKNMQNYLKKYQEAEFNLNQIQEGVHKNEKSSSSEQAFRWATVLTFNCIAISITPTYNKTEPYTHKHKTTS